MKRQKMNAFVAAMALVVTTASCSKEATTATNPQTHSPQMKVVSTTYPLASVSDPNISGTATFQQINNQTKITIQFSGTTPGQMYPAHIHHNSVAIGGGIAVSLNDVNGSSGRSVTIVSAMNNNTPLTYQDLLNFNGYINVHLSATQLSTIVAQGNIGSNF
jgi:hypothetical protein